MTGAVVDKPHILVVDDDRRIRELLQSYLMENGFLVSAARSAAEAREMRRGMVFDLMILDIMMPGENGIELTQSLRDHNDSIPVLMLSALADTSDRIAGLAVGSDDYLSKPFEPRELLLRIHNLLRRMPPVIEKREELRFGKFTFNMLRGELRKEDEVVKLTTREREILRLLAERAGSPAARNELAQPGSDDSARSVDVQVNRLRQKLESDPSNPVYLLTVRGAGYVLHSD
jgi:two-component system phosphate regulon response regulator OmpR